jgi:hypothetical protein
MDNVDVNDVATYVETLKMHFRDGNISDPQVRKAVLDLPSEAHIRRQVSHHEAQVLFETVRWAWKELTGNDLNDQFAMEPGAESLMGNYWMMKNGVLLHGVNHFVIIKRNLSLFSSMLQIDPFVLHQRIAGPADELIKLIIDNGGLRIFVTEDKRAYFQMNDQVYKNWGRSKVKGMDYPTRIVKLIDGKTDFKGWSSGIAIKL